MVMVGLVALGIITAGGTYFALQYSQPVKEEAVIPAQNPTPVPSVSQGISVEEVKAANEETLLNMEGVEKVDVGEKDGKPCVVVFTFKETDELHKLEANGLSGYKVQVENTSQTP